MGIELGRRGFLVGGLASLVAAPAIVRASSLMQIRGLGLPLRTPLPPMKWISISELIERGPPTLDQWLDEMAKAQRRFEENR